MSVFFSGLEWAKRNKGKLVLAGSLVGGMVALNKYLSSVVNSFDQSPIREYVSDVRKKENHFEDTLRTCSQTILDLSPDVISELEKHLNVDKILAKLLENQHQKETWSELRVCIFSRIIAEIFSFACLVCFVKTQVCVISGYNYVYTSKSQANPISGEGQLYYLSFMDKFYRRLIRESMGPIESAVDEATRDITLDQELTFQDLKNILEQIKNHILFYLDAVNLTKFMADDGQAFSAGHPKVKSEPNSKEVALVTKMLHEVEDVLESDDCKKVIKTTVDVGYSITMDLLFQCFGPSDPKESPNSTVFLNPHSKRIPFAKLLPALHHLLKRRSDSNEESSLVRHFLSLDVINCYAANIYEAFCNANE
ncbi:peroxisomal biogenesis factor 3 [Brevipalpus obovatus]|uniref:peroxisomal biogenesis factor 3 n=1 Tax=Brevipalpus obovatus TaxID=246614 RepID=UPI003D9F0E95